MFFRKKADEAVGSSSMAVGEGDAPWLRAQHAHENTNFRQGAQVANWRLFAFICLFGMIISVCWTGYIGSQSKVKPMIVEVDKLGRTVAVRVLDGDDAVTDASRSVYREMFDLMENLRTVSTDRIANNDRIEKGFSRLTGAARKYAKAELQKAPPNVVGTTKTVQVQVKTALRLTEKSWQIEWEEHPFTLNGEALPVENWKATVQYELSPTGEEQDIRTNPIGFRITELSWMKVI